MLEINWAFESCLGIQVYPSPSFDFFPHHSRTSYADDPERTEMMIYAEVGSPEDEEEVCLKVGRVLPKPKVVVKPRLPRPDDPTPRKPPQILRELRRAPSASLINLQNKKQKLSHNYTMEGIAASLGSAIRLGKNKSEPLFKVPQVPVKSGSKKGKEQAVLFTEEEDVFGPVRTAVSDEHVSQSSANDNGANISALERENKDVSAYSLLHPLLGRRSVFLLVNSLSNNLSFSS
jgi:hypothetical protein